MLRSLFASASSLRSHQDLLDVTGNNLANINTTGFKGQRIRFGTQFAEIIRSATPPGAPVGGTNPSQIGHGVRSIAVDSDFNQGTLEPTGNFETLEELRRSVIQLPTGSLVYLEDIADIYRGYKDPPRSVHLAARELQTYVEKITGARLSEITGQPYRLPSEAEW